MIVPLDAILDPVGRVACHCGSPTTRRTTFRFRYADGSPRQFLGCRRYPACDGIAALHQDGRLQSLPCDDRTRLARRSAHLAFDPLWQRGLMTRVEAYGRLMLVLGVDRDQAHIGYLDANEARGVAEHFGALDVAELVRQARRDERHASQHSRIRGRNHRRATSALRLTDGVEDVRDWGRTC